MAARPDQDATDYQGDVYARLGMTVTDEERRAAREQARAALARLDAVWTPQRWAELNARVFGDTAA